MVLHPGAKIENALRAAWKSFCSVLKDVKATFMHCICGVYIDICFTGLKSVQVYKKKKYIGTCRTSILNLSFPKFFKQRDAVQSVPVAFVCFIAEIFNNGLHAVIDYKLRVSAMICSHLRGSYVATT